MQILIIEDEHRAASQLQRMLDEGEYEYELLSVIDSVEDAVIWFKKNPSPDLVFMDIQLADGLSFEIFQKVEVEIPIIFTTAFDQYAIQAFKVNSIDYLLKPIQHEDLRLAMEKYFKTNKLESGQSDIFKQLLGQIKNKNKREGILVKDGSGFVQLKTSEFLYFYSEESITFGVQGTRRYIIDETMDQLFDSLDSSQFYRINRGQIIGKNSILKIEPYFNHRVKLNISQPRDQEFIVSRQKTSAFKDWLNQ